MIYTHTWSEVKDRYQEIVKTGKWPKGSQTALKNLVSTWNTTPNKSDGWSGGSANDTLGWIRNGFFSPRFLVSDIEAIPRRRKRAGWSEDDGDIDVSRLLGGSDDFYLARCERECKPGLTLDVSVTFSADVTPTDIAEYGAWIASFIGTLEAEGHDLEVYLTNKVSGLFLDDSVTQTRIIVKRPNEISDFSSWSVLFAPTGFRHLMFTAMCMSGDSANKRCGRGLGTPKANGWSVSHKGHIIEIDCATFGGSSAKHLTRSGREAGLIQ